jgi:hypothetical protein
MFISIFDTAADDLLTVPPLTSRFRAIVAEAVRRADAKSRAETGQSLATRMLLQYVEQEHIQVYSLRSPESIRPFKRRWPHRFWRVKGSELLWQPYNGYGEPIGPLWQFKTCDLLLLPAGTWRYAGENVCCLYDDRGTDDGYWQHLGRVIDETVDPIRRVRSLLWPRHDPPPSDANFHLGRDRTRKRRSGTASNLSPVP